MATVQQIFYRGIENGDWESIRKVYKALTKEEAPYPPQNNFLDQEIDEDEVEEYNPMEAEIEDDDEEEEEEEEEDEEDGQDESEEEPPPKGEFAIKHKNKTSRFAGKVQGKFAPMKIPKKRKNQYKDDLKLHANELVTKKPHLGTASRIKKRAETDRAETGRLVRVQCGLCGEEQEVSSLLAIGYDEDPDENVYRCESCCTPSGRLRVEREKEK